MPNVSVIMPLFNAEKYLPEALQSVLSQTYRDFELICINDCSTDHTAEILMNFQEKDARIKIEKNTERLGAGPSRNKGLKAAKGHYVIFLDGDDIFEEELLEKASGAMEKYQADIVLFEYLHVPSETIYEKKVIERLEGFTEDYCKVPFAMKDFEPRKFLWWPSSPCNKILRRSFIEKNRLEFQDLPSCNDAYFALMALFCAERIICLNDRRVMVYARDHSEPQRISNDRNPMCAYYAFEKLCEELNEREMLGQYAPYVYFRLPGYLMSVLSREKNEERKKNFYDFLHNKGVLQCVQYGKEYYDQINEYDKYLLQSFQNNVYETKWYDYPDTYFQVYLNKNGDYVCKFIRTKISEKKNIILWGAGRNGKILLEYLAMHSIKLFGVVDCDKDKQGTTVIGYEITDPAVFTQKADYIVVTSEWLYQEVSKLLMDTEIVVVNLLEILMERKVELLLG